MMQRTVCLGICAALLSACSAPEAGKQQQGAPASQSENVTAISQALGAPLALTDVSPNFRNQAAGVLFPWAGRMGAGAVDPTNENIALAASDSGGLFRTTNGGVNWTHIDTLGPTVMGSVRFSPTQPNIVIATVIFDLHNPSQAGIWRSTDGGATWQQPPSAIPPCGRVNAYGIAFSPDSNRVFVGHGCGLAISTDLGATWTHVAPAAGLGPVVHVEAQPGGIVNVMQTCNNPGPTFAPTCNENPADPNINPAATNIQVCNGFHRSLDNGATWPVTGANPMGGGNWLHSIAPSPFETNVVLAIGTRNPTGGSPFCARFDVLESDDGGVNWQSLNAPVNEGNGRPPFIRSHISRDGIANHWDIYYSDNTSMFRQTCSGTGPGLRCSTNWQPVTVGHTDNVDIAWPTNPNNCPKYLFGDGGPQLTTDCGASWTVTGGGPGGVLPGGLHALQIWDLGGTVHTASTDLYILSQDNGTWSSGDGVNWPNSPGAEGFNLEVVHNRATQDQLVQFEGCGNCSYFSDVADFSQPLSPWKSPPGTRPSSGPVAIDQNVWAQFGQPLLPPPNTVPPPTADNNLYVTIDNGNNWVASGAVVTETFRNIPGPPVSNIGTLERARVSGPVANPTLYMPVLKAANGAAGLKRVSQFRGGTPAVTNADVGIVVANSFFGFPVWNVDPQDPTRLVAVDSISNQLVFSSNSGSTWVPNNLGTATAHGSGSFFFNFQQFSGATLVGGVTSVSAVAIDNSNGNRILVGTEGNGIAATFDRGASWMNVPGSNKLPRITGFFFDERTADVYISTYARGLWKMGWCSNNGGPDTTPPAFAFVPPDIVTSNCGTIDLGTPRAVDVCASTAVTITNNRPTKFSPGTTLVTWTARDAAGNTTTATQRVTLILRDDPACCPAGTNIIIGTSNNDTLNGTAGPDCILGGKGAQDIINGNGGNDFISGGDGDDIINGGPGDDVVFGGSGQDNITDTSGDDQIFGDDGDDIIHGGIGNDILHGGQGQDQLFGDDGNDQLFGDDGSDTLQGGSGDDALVGGAATNTCTDAVGANTFTQCQPPAADSCLNGVKDGVETAVDCGRSCSTHCADGLVCVSGNDCTSGLCAGGVCAPSSGIATSVNGLVQGSFLVTTDWGSGYCVTLEAINNALVPTINWSMNLNIVQATTFTTFNGNFSGTTGAITVTPSASQDQVIPSFGKDGAIGFCANRNPGTSALPTITGVTGTFF